MSFKNIGKLSKEINDVRWAISNIPLDSIDNKDLLIGNIASVIDKLDDIDDINTIFKNSGVSKELAKDALEATHFADSLNNIVDGSIEAGTAVRTIDVTTKGLTSNAPKIATIGTILMGIKTFIVGSLKEIGTFLISNPLAMATAGLAAITLVAAKYNETYDTLRDKASNSLSDLSSTRSELSNVESQLSSVRSQIDEFNNYDGLTFVQQSELDKLKETEASLIRQKAILEATEKGQADIVAKDASNALNERKLSKAEGQKATEKAMSGGLKEHSEAAKNAKITTVDENVKENIKALNEYEKELAKAQEKQASLDEELYGTPVWEKYQKDIDDTTKKITETNKALGQDVEDLQNYRNALVNPDTGKAYGGFADDVKKIDDALNAYSEKINGISAVKAEKLNKIFSDNSEFAKAQQKIVDAIRNGNDISLDQIKNEFPGLVDACDQAGISVEELKNNLVGLATSDTGLTQIESDFEDFKSNVINAINDIDSINAALANSFSGKGLNVGIDEETGLLTGDIANVISAYKELDGYDPSILFERTANGVHLNREALRALKAEQEALQKESFKEKELELQQRLNEAIAEQQGMTGDEYSAQTAVINDLQSQLDTVQMLASAYDGATSAYQKWLDAQSNGEEGDMYRNVSETMRKRGSELWESGRYNTEEFRAIAQFYSNQDLSVASMDQVANAYASSIDKINRYFTGDKSGIDNFMYDMMNNADLMAQGIVKTLDDGTMEFQANSDKILAERFGMSEEAIQSILRAASEYNDKIKLGDLGSEDLTQKLAEATQKAEEAKSKLKELQEQGQISTDIEFNVDVSQLDEAGIDNRISSLEKLKEEAVIKFGADSSEVEYVNDLLDEAYTRKEQLAQETNVSVSVDINGEEDVTSLGEKLANLPSDAESNVSVTISNEEQLDNTVAQLEKIPPDTSTTITFTVSNQAEADSIQEKVDKLNENREIPINATFNVTDNSNELNLNTKETTATVNYKLGTQEKPKDKTAKVNYKASDTNANVKYSKDSSSIDGYKPSDKNAKVKFTKDSSIPDNYKPQDKTAKVNYTLGTTPSYNPSDLTRTVTYKIKTEGRISPANGTAHAGGSAYYYGNASSEGIAMWNHYRNASHKAYAGGNWGLMHNANGALVNELGSEIIVRDGQWFTINDGYPALANLKKGDIIFNHKQSEEILKNGYVTGSHGKLAYNSGSAFSSGNWVFGNTGNGNLGGTRYKSYSSTTSKKTSAKSVSDTATQAAQTASEVAEDLYNFVEILLTRTKELTKRLTDAIDDAVSLSDKMSKNSSALSQIQKEISVNQQAYQKYLAQANAVGLDEGYASQIRNGSLNIENITDEDLKKKIEDYKKWFEEAKNCQDAIRDLQKDEKQLALDRLDYIKDYYDAIEKLNSAYRDVNDTRIELNNALGVSAIGDEIKLLLQSSYDKQYESYNKALTQLSDYQSEFLELVRNGYIEEGSDAWYEGQATIQEFTKQVDEAAIALIELEDKIREIDYTRLEQLIEASERRSDQLKNAQSLAEARDEQIRREDYQKQIDELSNSINANYELRDKKLQEQNMYDVGSDRYKELAKQIADLDGQIYDDLIEIENLKNQVFEAELFDFEKEQKNLEYFISEIDDFARLLNEDAFFTKDGAFTDEAYAKIALTADAMSKCKQQIANATEALKKLDEMYQNGLISETEYTDKQRELLDTIRDNVSATESYKKELLDLYVTQARKENEALKKNIDLQKKRLQNQKDYWDYAESLKSKTKTVNEIEAQIAALQGVNNASAKAELKKLQQQLSDAKDELNSTKRDHQFNLMDEGYSSMSEKLDSSLEDLEYSIATSSEKQLEIVQSMLNQMVSSYQEAYNKINSIVNETGFQGTDSFNNTVSNTGSSSGASSIANGATQSQSTVKPSDSASNINSSNTSNSNHGAIESEIKKEPNTDNRLCAELTISATSVSVQEGSQTSITAKIRPNDAKNKTLSWTSADSSIASVSSEGKITGVKPGTTTVTVSTTDGSGLMQTCKVTVTKKPDPPKPTPPVQPSSPQGNGVPDVGDKVTFVSGIYHEDSYGGGRWGNWELGGSVYITKINPGAPYPIHISKGNRLGSSDRGWLRLDQLRGYNRGSKYIDRRQWAFMDDTENGSLDAGSEVIITNRGILKQFESGDTIFNNEQVQRLWEMSKGLDISRFINLNTSNMIGNLPNIVNRNEMNQKTEVNLNFD